MEYREVDVIEFTNKTNTPINASFTWSKSDILKNNLNSKKIRVRDFFINNKKLPTFIPQNKLDSVFLTNDPRATTTHVLNATLTPTSLDYFIVVRQENNSQSSIVYLNQPQINPNVNAPLNIVTDQYSYYLNKYFYYYDISLFLDLIRFAIIDGENAQTSKPNSINPVFTLTSSNFQLNCQNMYGLQYPYSALTYGGTWIIEFSPSLNALFPFKSVLTSIGTYQLIFNDIPININGNIYNQIVCPFYSTIYPFSSIMFTSDDSALTPESLIGNDALLTNNRTGTPELVFLRFNITPNQITSIYDFFQFTNLYDSFFVNFSNDSNQRANLTMKIYIRLKATGQTIPFILDVNETAKISLETKYDK